MIPFLMARGLSPALAKLLTLALPLLVIAAAYLIGDHNGANRVKDRVTAERAAANVQVLTTDAAAKEQAATERANDTATITQIQRNQEEAIHGATDADIRRNAACQRLRAARGDQAATAAGC